MITRPRRQAGALIARLESLGAIPIVFPTISISPPIDAYQALDGALLALDSFDWVVFTSVNGVTHVWKRLESLNIVPDAMKKHRLAAIGPATRDALIARGLAVEIIPRYYVAEALLASIPDPSGQRFLLPRASGSRDVLSSGLVERGADVTEVHAYRSVPVQPTRQQLAELDTGVDYVTFTSSSTVRNFCKLLNPRQIDRICHTARIVVIGPVTAETARQAGLPIHAIADEYTIDGLVAALENSQCD